MPEQDQPYPEHRYEMIIDDDVEARSKMSKIPDAELTDEGVYEWLTEAWSFGATGKRLVRFNERIRALSRELREAKEGLAMATELLNKKPPKIEVNEGCLLTDAVKERDQARAELAELRQAITRLILADMTIEGAVGEDGSAVWWLVDPVKDWEVIAELPGSTDKPAWAAVLEAAGVLKRMEDKTDAKES